MKFFPQQISLLLQCMLEIFAGWGSCFNAVFSCIAPLFFSCHNVSILYVTEYSGENISTLGVQLF